MQLPANFGYLLHRQTVERLFVAIASFAKRFADVWGTQISVMFLPFYVALARSLEVNHFGMMQLNPRAELRN